MKATPRFVSKYAGQYLTLLNFLASEAGAIFDVVPVGTKTQYMNTVHDD